MTRHNHRESTKIAKRRWWEKYGLETGRRYQRSAKGQASSAKNSAIRRASKDIEASLTADQWKEILAFHQFRCVYCKRHFQKLEQDHVIPISKGGMHTKENVVPACRSCNARKSSQLLHH